MYTISFYIVTIKERDVIARKANLITRLHDIYKQTIRIPSIYKISPAIYGTPLTTRVRANVRQIKDTARWRVHPDKDSWQVGCADIIMRSSASAAPLENNLRSSRSIANTVCGFIYRGYRYTYIIVLLYRSAFSLCQYLYTVLLFAQLIRLYVCQFRDLNPCVTLTLIGWLILIKSSLVRTSYIINSSFVQSQVAKFTSLVFVTAVTLVTIAYNILLEVPACVWTR